MPNKDITLYLDHSSPPPVVCVTETDTAWTFRFTVMYNNAVYAPNVANVILAGHKPDGNAFAFAGSKSGNVFTVACNVQMTAVPGDVHAALHLLGGGNTAIPFILRVAPGAAGTAPVASASALPAYTTILNKIGNFPANLSQYVSDWLAENISGGAVVDASLTVSGAAADAKETGDRLADLENAQIETDSTLTQEGAAADAKAVGDAIRAITGDDEEGSETTTDTFLFTEPYYHTDDGKEMAGGGTTSSSTVFIPIEGQTAIYYSGRTGGTCASWFTRSKVFIGKTTDASKGTGLVNYNILQDAPANAYYVVCMSRPLTNANPPSVSPVVKTSVPISTKTSHKIHGDDSTDDTAALQWMVDNHAIVELDPGMTIKITDSIFIDPAVCKFFDGKNARIKIYGDFPAFIIEGSMATGQTASTAPASAIHQEAGFTFQNVRICHRLNESAPSSAHGTGILVRGTFKAKISNNYLYCLNNGISVEGVNRDMIISNNHVFNCHTYGLVFNNGVDIHQCNIVGNVLEYAYRPLTIINPLSLANFQITGNDIEIGSMPTSRTASAIRAIEIISGSTFGAQPILQEIEITGNTIQGHSGCDNVIYIEGDTNRYVQLLSLVGNHISNCKGHLVTMDRVRNITIIGNTCKDVTGREYNLIRAEKVAISGESSINVGEFVRLSETCSNIIIAGCVSNAGIVATGTVERSSITGNIISGADLQPTSGAILLANNFKASNGAYTTNELVTAVNNL